MKQFYFQNLRLTTVLIILAVLGIFNVALAQAPQAIPYQGVARNASGNILSNQNIGLRIKIHDLTAAGAIIYSETHSTTTTSLGLFNANVGSGTPVVGTLAGVNWGVGAKFLQVEMDPAGGSSYIDMGTTQLNSVPYALFAGLSGSSASASGTLNFIPKWTPNGTTLGNSLLFDDGNSVGLGTVTPGYRLDVLHGGATGIRSRSSASFSVVDIDAQSGDAALRFAKAGVNQWNIRNRPADDYLEIFELGGGGSRMVIQDATGNVGIGETTNPAYKLDVLHDGATGIRSRSSASFSVVDIDGQTGDAALRFQRAGVNQWNIRNDPANDNLQIFELGGGGERMRIENTTGKVVVTGDFTAVGVKAFTMDHPLDLENKILMHAAAESNEVINFYSGNITTDASGKAVVKLPDYFEAINKDFRYQLTVVGTFAQAIISKEVDNNHFEIATSVPNVKVSWEVKGVRNDARMKKYPFVAEQEKTAAQKGKYWDPSVHNQPESKGVSFDKNQSLQSSLNDMPPAATNAKFKGDDKTSSSIGDMVPPAKAAVKPTTPEGPSSTSETTIIKQ
jgi:hypothetical protein